MNENNRICSLVVLALVLSVFVLMPVAAAGTTVRIDPVTTVVLHGNTTTVYIVIDTTENIAAADIWLNYDSSIAKMTAVDDGTFAGLTFTPIATANTNDQMKINWAHTNPKTGNGLVYAKITFSAEGSAGQQTDLKLTVNSMSDPVPTSITATSTPRRSKATRLRKGAGARRNRARDHYTES